MPEGDDLRALNLRLTGVEERAEKVEKDNSKLGRLFYIVIALVVALAGLLAVFFLTAPRAAADPIVIITNPVDVHWPQYYQGWCPGGRGGFFVYYCDGRPFADGTAWHFDTALGMRCVARLEMNAPDAPPGGCNGAW